MMGAAVNAVDDCERRTIQFIVQAASKEAADDGIAARFCVQHEFSYGALKTTLLHTAVNTLDDVARFAKGAKRRFYVLGHPHCPGPTDAARPSLTNLRARATGRLRSAS